MIQTFRNKGTEDIFNACKKLIDEGYKLPDTKWIAYNYKKNLHNEVRLINRKSGEETIIFDGGRFPECIGNELPYPIIKI